MFSIGDDFDVDEDFLESAFAIESNSTKRACPSENVSECSTPEILQVTNIRPLHNQTPEQVPGNSSKNDEFVSLWNSKEEDLFFSRSPSKRVNPRNLLDVARAESPMGFKSEVVTRVAKNVLLRKFPGPAGLLPERTSNTSFIAAEEYISKIENENSNLPGFEEKEIFSQATNKIFEEPSGAWRTMMDELGSHGVKLISTINLATIRVKQARFGFKVPFLAVCVNNIDCSLPDPSVLLKDQKDEMHGTLHREVWEEWKGEIVVGSVLVLRNTGVITAGMSSRRYFLNITANNITTIYTPKNDSNLKITQIQSVSSLDTSQILEEWEKVMSQTSRQPQQQCTEQQSRPLFSTFSPMPSPSFRPVASPIQRPSPQPIRPTFRPRASVQPQRQPLRSHNAPRQQLTNNNRMALHQKPMHGSPNISNNSLNKNFTSQENVSPQQRNTPKSSNTNFKLKAEVFKTQLNSSHLEPISSKPIGSPTSTSVCREGLPTVPANKKAKISPPQDLKPAFSTSSVFTVSSANHSSIVESVLDGIDTDLFFDDF